MQVNLPVTNNCLMLAVNVRLTCPDGNMNAKVSVSTLEIKSNNLLDDYPLS